MPSPSGRLVSLVPTLRSTTYMLSRSGGKQALPIVRIQNPNDRNAPFNHAEEKTVEPRHLIDSGDVLLSWSGTPGTSFGVFIWERGRAALNQHIFKCGVSEAVAPEWFKLAVNERISEILGDAHGGVGLKHLTKGQLEEIQIPVPPLPEQGRILRKLGEVMGMIDDVRCVLAS